MPSWLRRLGAVLFVGTAFFFLGLAMARQGQQLQTFSWQIRPLRLVLSLVLHITVLAFGVILWGHTLGQLGHRLGYRALARAWFLSNLARYIPGKIWQFVGVAEILRAVGVPRIVAVTSVVVYTGFILLSAWLVGLYLVPAEALGAAADFVAPARAISPILLIALHPRLLDRLITFAGKVTRRPVLGWQGRWSTAFWLLAGCIILWLGFGVAFHVFVGSLTDVSLAQYPRLTGIFALAFLAGYIVLIAPAGLGAKEGALTGLLLGLLPLSVAAAVAVATRIWSAVAEVVPALFFLRGAAGDRAHASK